MPDCKRIEMNCGLNIVILFHQLFTFSLSSEWVTKGAACITAALW